MAWRHVVPGTRSAVKLALAGWVLLGGLLAGCGPIVEAAKDYRPRQWILRDVYLLGQDPLFWTSGR